MSIWNDHDIAICAEGAVKHQQTDVPNFCEGLVSQSWNAHAVTLVLSDTLIAHFTYLITYLQTTNLTNFSNGFNDFEPLARFYLRTITKPVR